MLGFIRFAESGRRPTSTRRLRAGLSCLCDYFADFLQDLMLQFGLGLSDAEFELNFGEKPAVTQ
jgi:hypothetical protein